MFACGTSRRPKSRIRDLCLLSSVATPVTKFFSGGVPIWFRQRPIPLGPVAVPVLEASQPGAVSLDYAEGPKPAPGSGGLGPQHRISASLTPIRPRCLRGKLREFSTRQIGLLRCGGLTPSPDSNCVWLELLSADYAIEASQPGANCVWLLFN